MLTDSITKFSTLDFALVMSNNFHMSFQTLFLSFLLSFAPSVNADSFCTFKSEAETDVTLAMNKPYAGWGFGTLNYKNESKTSRRL